MSVDVVRALCVAIVEAWSPTEGVVTFVPLIKQLRQAAIREDAGLVTYVSSIKLPQAGLKAVTAAVKKLARQLSEVV
jgi:hypothetical protein